MISEFKGEYSWLSNFEPVKITLAGVEYASVEHAYMSAKSDNKAWKLFCVNPKNSAGKIKKESYTVKLVEDWNTKKFTVMKMCLTQKYNQELFKSKLIETENQNIQEGNYHGDVVWGIDLKTSTNIGENHLGRMIMEIRQQLIEADSKKKSLVEGGKMDFIAEAELVFSTVNSVIKNLLKGQDECLNQIFMNKEFLLELANRATKAPPKETFNYLQKVSEAIDFHNTEIEKALPKMTLNDDDILAIEKCFLEKYAVEGVDESERKMAQSVIKFINLLTMVHTTQQEKELFYLNLLRM